MTDYIERQAVLDVVCDLPTWYGDAGCLPFGDPQPPMEALMYPEDVISAINNLPSADVVVVVRCKDCKHREAETGLCEGRGWPMQLVPDDGFCDKGERGEENGT